MEHKTFFEHYRISEDNGSPIELTRSGELTTYKSVDTRFGDPVAITRIPVADVDLAVREQFEKQTRAARVLDHVNIAKVLGFGIEHDHYVLVSEYIEGETLQEWTAAHGPMPPEAALRVGLQVVNALAAAGFHEVTHGAIQPSNLVIVPGETAEGGWPFVKLTNFGLAGLKLGSQNEASLLPPQQFASPEKLQNETSDFRSEIYSLGATMFFLLTGVRHSAEARPRQLRRFPKPIRNLLAHMLRDNPDERPHDPVLFAEAIRECLVKVERRQEFARRFGIPFVPVVRKLTARPRLWLPRRALALAALVLMLTALAAVLWPENLKRILHRNRDVSQMGVPIGVPEASSAPLAPSFVKNAAPSEANVPAVASANQSVRPVEPARTSAVSANQVAPSSSEIAANNQTSEPEPPTEGPDDSAAATVDSASGQTSVTQNTNAGADNSTHNVATESASASDRQADVAASATTKAPAKTKATASTAKRRSITTSRRTRIAQTPSSSSYDGLPPLRPGSFRARVVGTTPDGRLLLGLPSGETAIVEPPRRRARRIFTERRERFLPPLQPFDPTFPPVD